MISYIDFFVPEGRASVEDIFTDFELRANGNSIFSSKSEGVTYFRNALNIKEVAYAESVNENELIAPLLTRLFSQRISPAEIQLVIVIGDELNKGERLANFGHYIQYHYQLSDADVLVISGNHCANIEYAVTYAETFLSSPAINNVLLVAVNKVVRHWERIIGNYAIQGDAAGIALLTKEQPGGIAVRDKYSLTCGALYEANVELASPLLLCKNYMSCINGLLKKTRLKPKDFSNVIIQNANHSLMTQCLTSAGFANDQIFTKNLSAFGHLDCIDFLVNLRSIIDEAGQSPVKVFCIGTGWAGSNISLYLETVSK